MGGAELRSNEARLSLTGLQKGQTSTQSKQRFQISTARYSRRINHVEQTGDPLVADGPCLGDRRRTVLQDVLPLHEAKQAHTPRIVRLAGAAAGSLRVAQRQRGRLGRVLDVTHGPDATVALHDPLQVDDVRVQHGGAVRLGQHVQAAFQDLMERGRMIEIDKSCVFVCRSKIWINSVINGPWRV